MNNVKKEVRTNPCLRIVAMILMLATLLSLFAVFAAAEDSSANGDNTTGEGDSNTSGITVLYNRGYEEGWDFGNGLSYYEKDNDYHITYELTEDYSYNYYINMEYVNAKGGYIQGDIASPSTDHFVFEMDISTDELYDVGRTFYLKLSSTHSEWILNVEDNYVYALGDTSTKTSILQEWVHVAFVLDFTRTNAEDATEEEKNSVLIKAYIGDQYTEKTFYY